MADVTVWALGSVPDSRGRVRQGELRAEVHGWRHRHTGCRRKNFLIIQMTGDTIVSNCVCCVSKVWLTPLIAHPRVTSYFLLTSLLRQKKTLHSHGSQPCSKSQGKPCPCLRHAGDPILSCQWPSWGVTGEAQAPIPAHEPSGEVCGDFPSRIKRRTLSRTSPSRPFLFPAWLIGGVWQLPCHQELMHMRMSRQNAKARTTAIAYSSICLRVSTTSPPKRDNKYIHVVCSTLRHAARS